MQINLVTDVVGWVTHVLNIGGGRVEIGWWWWLQAVGCIAVVCNWLVALGGCGID